MYIGSVRNVLPRERFKLGKEWLTCMNNVGGVVKTREGVNIEYDPNIIDTDNEVYVYLTANKSTKPLVLTTMKNEKSGVVHLAYSSGYILCGGFSQLGIGGSKTNCKRCLEIEHGIYKKVIH